MPNDDDVLDAKHMYGEGDDGEHVLVIRGVLATIGGHVSVGCSREGTRRGWMEEMGVWR